MNNESSGRSRSPVFRLADWAEYLELRDGRRKRIYWERDEAVSKIKGNGAIETVSSVFLVATMVKEESRYGVDDYKRRMVVEDVAFIGGGEAVEWGNEMLDGDFEVVEVSLKGQL